MEWGDWGNNVNISTFQHYWGEGVYTVWGTGYKFSAISVSTPPHPALKICPRTTWYMKLIKKFKFLCDKFVVVHAAVPKM